MKFGKFISGTKKFQGVVVDQLIKEIEGDIFGEWEYTGQSFSLKEVKCLSPLEPNNIIGIGANYVSEIEDLPSVPPKMPVFFFKPTSSVIGHEESIVIPHGIEKIKFESELAVVIGKETKNVSEESALDYIFGYTIGNDVTAPQFFHEDGHWTIGKSFDTFTPLGPFIETDLVPSKVKIEARLNDVEKQNSSTELMIVSIQKMISFLSKVMTLKPGDVILTGSPIGAEMVGEGDFIECEIKEIGILTNRFVTTKEAVEVN
ncbi:fumarylacetoacetate hydrolase family protein [Pseudalkalibacillus decolorationis]|uniref:fumarylacetoacetate hydrolase family protein n=1 Tax=Pseudalkalibacillus decolorationis TaxID=163879 RepID=UPI0021491D50|nr:fumarylacetoacetate hydrolase family protein [Pseudalkalibacillus decolorationis]